MNEGTIRFATALMKVDIIIVKHWNPLLPRMTRS